MELVKIGRIIKPQGIKGELKYKPNYSDSVLNNTNLQTVFISGVKHNVSSHIVRFGYGYLLADDISDRNTAELYRGKEISIEKSVLTREMGDDNYLIEDLINCEIQLESGEIVGKIQNILQYGSADILEIKEKSGKVVSLPYLKSLVAKIDITGKVITVVEEEYKNLKVE